LCGDKHIQHHTVEAATKPSKELHCTELDKTKNHQISASALLGRINKSRTLTCHATS
jgi:hypothetical protein